MAARPSTRQARRPARTPEVDMLKVRVQPEWIPITDIHPYPYNPRKNAKAIAAVTKSIQNFGFIIPVVVDRNGELAAGHTRHQSAMNLGMTELLAIRAEHLTPEQIDAFRIIDNKTAELADWDTELLGPEMSRVKEVLGDLIDFTDYGWTQEEVDCLQQVISDDCLSVEGLTEQPENHVTERRAPATARIVLGEFVFFITRQRYVEWIDGLRRLHNFDQAAMEDDIKQRLGILED